MKNFKTYVTLTLIQAFLLTNLFIGDAFASNTNLHSKMMFMGDKITTNLQKHYMMHNSGLMRGHKQFNNSTKYFLIQNKQNF